MWHYPGFSIGSIAWALLLLKYISLVGTAYFLFMYQRRCVDAARQVKRKGLPTCSSMWRRPSTGSGVFGGGTDCFSFNVFLLQQQCCPLKQCSRWRTEQVRCFVLKAVHWQQTSTVNKCVQVGVETTHSGHNEVEQARSCVLMLCGLLKQCSTFAPVEQMRCCS